VPYLLALALTLVVEVPVYAVVFRFAGLLPGWRGWAAAVGINLVTHPVVWLVLRAHPGWFVPAEVGAVAVEAGLLWGWVRRDAVVLGLTAVAANSASVTLGLLLPLLPLFPLLPPFPRS
jgi:hypothetical protein